MADELPASLTALGQKVLEDPIVRHSFGITHNEIKMVELVQLVVFQKHINLAYTRELEQALGDHPNDEDIFDFCLPIDPRHDPPTRVAPIAAGPKGPAAWAMVSPSADLRVLKTVLLDPSQVIGLSSEGTPTQIVAVIVGYGSSFINRDAGREPADPVERKSPGYTLHAAGHTPGAGAHSEPRAAGRAQAASAAGRVSP